MEKKTKNNTEQQNSEATKHYNKQQEHAKDTAQDETRHSKDNRLTMTKTNNKQKQKRKE